MKLKYLAVFLTMLTSSLGCLAASPNINPGEWEFQMKMDGMPKNMPTKKFRTCMDQNNPVPKDAAAHDSGACKTNHKFISASEATWTATCKMGSDNMTTQGKGTYHGDKMEVTQSTSMGGRTFSVAYSGRRVGACPGKTR